MKHNVVASLPQKILTLSATDWQLSFRWKQRTWSKLTFFEPFPYFFRLLNNHFYQEAVRLVILAQVCSVLFCRMSWGDPWAYSNKCVCMWWNQCNVVRNFKKQKNHLRGEIVFLRCDRGHAIGVCERVCENVCWLMMWSLSVSLIRAVKAAVVILFTL